MPIPKPNGGESHDDFIDRCMGNDTMVSEYPDNKQRYAICQSSWDDSKKAGHDQGIERRFIKAAELRVANQPDGKTTLPKLEGYAALFDTPAQIWPDETERISSGAFARSLKEKQDVRALVDHDPSKLLARTKAGTLELSEDGKGLHVLISPPDTTIGRDTVESIRRGDLDQMSFAFRVIRDTFTDNKDGTYERVIEDLDLFDVSVVTYPAYEETTIGIARQRLQEWRARNSATPAPPAKPPRQRQPEEILIEAERQRQDILERRHPA